MIQVSAYSGKTVAVLGLGKSGIATVRALVAAGAMVWAWDDNEKARRYIFQFGLAPLDLSHVEWSEIDTLVISPGIPNLHPTPHPAAAAARAAGVPIICDVELMATSQADAGFTGLTGTNGKSTTTALLGHVFDVAGRSHAVGGNLGTPALELPALGQDGDYILELSSYQIELLKNARIDAACLLNITPDHLDRHGGFDGYVEAKRRLFDRLGCGGWAVVCTDDAASSQVYASLKSRADIRRVEVSAERMPDHGVSAKDGKLVDLLGVTPVVLCDLWPYERLRGRHNHQNVAVAYALARARGIEPEIFVKALESFTGLAHRQELVGKAGDIPFINDSKATNAEAAAKALGAYDQIHWIVGGRAKETGLDGLEPFYKNIARAYVIGEAEATFSRTLAAAGVDHLRCGTLDKAVDAAAKGAKSNGGVVLLSPACASWDQFDSFEARGEAFRTAALKHIDAGGTA